VTVAGTVWAGHDEVTAQAQWATNAPAWVLGARPDPLTGTVTAPSESSLRRALTTLDATELQRRSTVWTQALLARDTTDENTYNTGDSVRPPAVAIDGTSLHGAATGDHTRTHLLSAPPTTAPS